MCLAQRSTCDNVANSKDVTFSITSPRDGSLWVATRSRGILRVGRPGRAFSYSSINGVFPCDNIVSLAFDSLAVLWMRDAEGSVFSYSSLDGFRKQNDVPEPVRIALYEGTPLEDVTFSNAEESYDNTSGHPVKALPAWPFILISLLLLAAMIYLLRGRSVREHVDPRSAVKHTPAPAMTVDDGKPVVPVAAENTESGAFSAKVSELIASNYANPDFSVEKIADILGITRVHLNRRLKMENSPSPKDMLKKVRMDKAAELLKQGVPVASIASECGFSSPSYFSSAFKEYYGVSPKAYLES